MRDIIRDLCDGNYEAFARSYTQECEQAKLLGAVVDFEEKLSATLSEEQ